MRGIAYKSTYISLKMVTFLKLYFLFISTCPLLLGPFRSHISSVSLCTSDQTLFQQPCGTWNSDATEISASEICVKRPADKETCWQVCLQSPVQRLGVFPLDLGGRLSHLFQWTSARWLRGQTLLHYQLFSSPTLGAFAGLWRDPAPTPMRAGWKLVSGSVPVCGSTWSTGCWVICPLLSL